MQEDVDQEPLGLLTPSQAARRIGMAMQTLARWRVEGREPHWLKVGGRCFYRVATIESFLASRERSSTSEDSANKRSERTEAKR